MVGYGETFVTSPGLGAEVGEVRAGGRHLLLPRRLRVPLPQRVHQVLESSELVVMVRMMMMMTSLVIMTMMM